MAKQYDLALIFVGFQRCCMYAAIINELSKKYRIAIFPQKLDDKVSVRIENTNKQFLKLCEDFGAKIVDKGEIDAQICILPQTNYSQEQMETINRTISAQKFFWTSGVAMGNAQYEFLYGKKIDRILVVDRKFYDYRLDEYEKDSAPIFRNDEIVEIGIPYKKYPIFPDLGIDYLVATPTPFSFSNLSERLQYLENVCSLVDQLDSKSVIAFKPHNADERYDYLVDRRIYSLFAKGRFKSLYPSIDKLCRKVSSMVPKTVVANYCIHVSIAIMYQRLMSRVVKLSEITEWHNLNLEVFLPSIKMGMITGRSNSIWHALFLNIPVYNCVEENTPYFSQTKMHKFSMMYFGVHGNYKSKKFERSLFKRIKDQTRNSDLIAFLQNQLENVQCSSRTLK